MAEQPFIQFDNITKSYGKKVILDNLSLNISYKNIFGIIGRSGSGKTTLLSLLVGFLKPDRGQILFQSRDIYRDLQSVQQQFGFAAQEGSFYTKLTVDENLRYFGRMYNINPKVLKEKIPELLRLVELEDAHDLIAWKLSAGMQKRLDIACALIHDPKVLILDEPTEDLDPALRNEILDLLKKINHEKDITIIITSHLLDEVEYICKDVAILDKKKIIDSGNINDLKNKYSRYSEVSIETEDRDYAHIIKIIKRKKDVKKYSIRGNSIYIYTTQKGEKALRNILSSVKKSKAKIVSISMGKPSLTELFEELTKQEVKPEIKEVKKQENVKASRDNKEKS
ncbi:MAG: ABC transporter ATP-binding protein [Nanoarchaeota archaeon]